MITTWLMVLAGLVLLAAATLLAVLWVRAVLMRGEGWLRSLLGVIPPSYTCPNPTCAHADVLALGVISRPVPGRPWRQRKVGSLNQCAKCGLRYIVTVEGVYQPLEGPQRGPARPMATEMTEYERRTVDSMLEDLRRSSEPGE